MNFVLKTLFMLLVDYLKNTSLLGAPGHGTLLAIFTQAVAVL